MISGQRRNLDIMDQSALQGRIEIAHCLSVEVYYTTRCERPDVIYFNDDLPAGTLNEGIPQLPAMANPAKFSTQINLDRGSPRRWVIALAGGCLSCSRLIPGSKGVVH